MIPTTSYVAATCEVQELSEEKYTQLPRGWGVTPKLDGWMTIIRRDGDETLRVSRNQKPVRYDIAVPDKTLLVGELYVPGKDSFSVTTAIAQGSGAKFAVFGVAFLNGEDFRQATFYEALEACHHAGLDFLQAVGLVATVPYSKLIDPPLGHDGYVIKGEQWPSAPRSWKKVKRRKEADLRLVGFTSGQGMLRPRPVGSLLLRSDDGTVQAACSGMDDEVRAKILSGEIPVGSLITISYQKKLKQGLREPQFVGVRLDKDTTSSWSDLQ